MQAPEQNTPSERGGDYWHGFINEEAAAEFLCQSIRTIQKWRTSGFGPQFYKTGRSVRYRRRDLDAWATDRSRRHTSEY